MIITHIQYTDNNGNGWSRLSRPDQLDADLKQLYREERATVISITHQER